MAQPDGRVRVACGAMAQQPVEVILMRELAGKLTMPAFLVDVDGNLIFYNEPAEELLGSRFDETGALPAAEWSTQFRAADDRGRPLAPESLPLVHVLASHRPSHGQFWIHGLDGVDRYLEVTAFPLLGQGGTFVAACALFWEVARR
jgi:PAS domain-containing protein